MLLPSAGWKRRKHVPLGTLVEDGRGTSLRTRQGRTHSIPVTGKTLLGDFTELRKATSTFPMSVRPRLHGKTRLPLEGIFVNFYIWVFFEKNCQETKNIYSNLTRINGALHEELRTFVTESRWILLRMRNVSDKIFRENQNTFCVQ